MSSANVVMMPQPEYVDPPYCQCCYGAGRLRVGIRIEKCGVCDGTGFYNENAVSQEFGLNIAYYDKITGKQLHTKKF